MIAGADMMPVPEWCMRTQLLVGEEAMQRLMHSHILVAGLGGVGGYVAELLVRSGVGAMTIVDADTVQLSNINRQLIALQDNMGKPKAELWAERLLRINPELKLTVLNRFIEEGNMDELLGMAQYDFVADAIDSVAPKTALLAACYARKLPVVSAMGAGAKSDPMAIRCDDIGKSHTCTLARVVRARLRKEGIKKGIPVIYSIEKPKTEAVMEIEGERNKRSTAGTLSYLTALFGCHMAGYIIRALCSLNE
ncbi:tRNA threonylcarbamoyladenosine dehydratase [Porphyromonas macacae]|uniref:tRNA threonylcarbamoyladenosine dehydratase n=1 Tax=Porphyromonas macacae TaxID=28115 RepID=UPI0035A19238